MKKLLLVRHAQTEPFSDTGKDLDRVLTSKGFSDAGKMAAYLHREHFKPDFIYTSIATRTQQTASVFLDVLGVEDHKMKAIAQLYGPSVFDFYSVIEQFPNEYQTVAIFTHNPGISDFINDLECHDYIRLIPGSCFGVTFNTDSWMDFMMAKKEVFLYKTPGDVSF